MDRHVRLGGFKPSAERRVLAIYRVQRRVFASWFIPITLQINMNVLSSHLRMTKFCLKFFVRGPSIHSSSLQVTFDTLTILWYSTLPKKQFSAPCMLQQQ